MQPLRLHKLITQRTAAQSGALQKQVTGKNLTLAQMIYLLHMQLINQDRSGVHMLLQVYTSVRNIWPHDHQLARSLSDVWLIQ